MTSGNGATQLQFGSNVIELILPQRRPMLMVDQVTGFRATPKPRLEASRYISANEIFFAGHFPGLHLWPGCLTIEGMGQTSALLVALMAIRDGFTKSGRTPDDALDALRNLDLGFRMHPGFRQANAETFLAEMKKHRAAVSVGAAVDVKLLKPVYAGQRLDYVATIEHNVGELMRFGVEASVNGAAVASGTMTGARMYRTMSLLTEG